MRVVVIGGRGFVGRHVVDTLARSGHEVAVVGRGEPLVDGDVAVHLALYSEAQTRDAVAALRGRVDRWVVASSGDVYRAYGWVLGIEPGSPAEGAAPLDEDAPLRTRLYPYGREPAGPSRIVDYEKILVERVISAAATLPWTILRLPKVYGPGNPQGTFGAWCDRLAAGEPILLSERVAGWRWTHGHVADVAEAFALAATQSSATGRVYNVGEADTPTMIERARRLATAVRRRDAVSVVPDAEVPPELRIPIAEAVDLVYDTHRIRAELGWRERPRDLTADVFR